MQYWPVYKATIAPLHAAARLIACLAPHDYVTSRPTLRVATITLATSTLPHQLQTLSAHASDPHLWGTILSHGHRDSNSHHQLTIATSVRQQY